jgi:hypothetical protein
MLASTFTNNAISGASVIDLKPFDKDTNNPSSTWIPPQVKREMPSASIYSIHLPALAQSSDTSPRKTLNHITTRLYEPIRDAEILTQLGRLRTKLSLSTINDSVTVKNDDKPKTESKSMLKTKSQKSARSTSRPLSNSCSHSKSARSVTPHRPRTGKSKRSKAHKTTHSDTDESKTKNTEPLVVRNQDQSTVISYNSSSFHNNNTPRTKVTTSRFYFEGQNKHPLQRSPTSIPDLKQRMLSRDLTSIPTSDLSKNNVKNSIRKSTKNRYDNIYKRIDFFSNNEFIVNDDFVQVEPVLPSKALESGDSSNTIKKRKLHPSLRWNLIR